MYCPKCGKNIPDLSLICSYCGTPISNSQYTNTSQAKWYDPRYTQPNPTQGYWYDPRYAKPKVKKKNGKKIAGILAVCLLASYILAVIVYQFSVGVKPPMASDIHSGGVITTTNTSDFDSDGVISTTNVPDNSIYYSNITALFTSSDDLSYCYYGKTLNQHEQFYYYQLYKYYIQDKQKGDCLLYSPEPYLITIDGRQTDSNSAKDKETLESTFGDAINAEFEKSFAAFTMDFVELYWWDFTFKTKYEWELVRNNNSSGDKTEKKTYKVDSFTCHPNEIYPGAADDADRFQSELNIWCSEISARAGKNADDYVIVKTIHDYLCEKVEYSYDANGEPDHLSGAADNASGALIQQKAVCSGYTAVFRLLCIQFDIPSLCCSGHTAYYDKNAKNIIEKPEEPGHAWNLVQMDNGLWYGIDVTWDDNNDDDTIAHNYFLKGSNDLADNYCTFFQTHLYDEPSPMPKPAMNDYQP